MYSQTVSYSPAVAAPPEVEDVPVLVLTTYLLPSDDVCTLADPEAPPVAAVASEFTAEESAFVVSSSALLHATAKAIAPIPRNDKILDFMFSLFVSAILNKNQTR